MDFGTKATCAAVLGECRVFMLPVASIVEKDPVGSTVDKQKKYLFDPHHHNPLKFERSSLLFISDLLLSHTKSNKNKHTSEAFRLVSDALDRSSLHNTGSNESGFSQVAFGEIAESLPRLLQRLDHDSSLGHQDNLNPFFSSSQQSSLICGLRTLMALSTQRDSQSFEECKTWPFLIEDGDKSEVVIRVGRLVEQDASPSRNSFFSKTALSADIDSPSFVRYLKKRTSVLVKLFFSHFFHQLMKKKLKVNHVVLAVSPSLSKEHIAKLKTLLGEAGFPRVDCLLSPFAVVLAYLEYRERQLGLVPEEITGTAPKGICSPHPRVVPQETPTQKFYMVVYWGASNAEACIVKCDGVAVKSALRLVGVQVARNCGGLLLTEKLVQHCRSLLLKKLKPSGVDIDDAVTLSLIRAECEHAKILLSSQSSAVVSIPSLNFTTTISRSLLNRESAAIISEIVRCMMTLLKSLDLTPRSLSEVFLAGGSVYMPQFRKALKTALGNSTKITCDLNATEVLAAGASVKAAFFEDIQCRQEIFMRLTSASCLLLPLSIKNALSPDDINTLVGDELQAGQVLSVLDKFSVQIPGETEQARERMDEHMVDMAKVSYVKRGFNDFAALLDAMDAELEGLRMEKISSLSSKTAFSAVSPPANRRKGRISKQNSSKKIPKAVLGSQQSNEPVQEKPRLTTAEQLQEQLINAFPLASHEEIDAQWAPAAPDAPTITPESVALLFAPSEPPPISIIVSEPDQPVFVAIDVPDKSSFKGVKRAPSSLHSVIDSDTEVVQSGFKIGWSASDEPQKPLHATPSKQTALPDKSEPEHKTSVDTLDDPLEASLQSSPQAALPSADTRAKFSGDPSFEKSVAIMRSKTNFSPNSKSVTELPALQRQLSHQTLRDNGINSPHYTDAGILDEEQAYQHAMIQIDNDEEEHGVDFGGNGPAVVSSYTSFSTSPFTSLSTQKDMITRAPSIKGAAQYSFAPAASFVATAAFSPIARKRRAAILAQQREHLPDLALASAADRQKILLEMQQGSVVEMAELPHDTRVELALRSVLLLLEFGRNSPST
jgi:hypothetical protein